MTNTKTEDVKATLEQIRRLEEAGCEIIRVAVPSMEAAHAIKDLKSEIKVPLVADIHFNHKLAMESIRNGADKIRINPGNIGGFEKTRQVLEVAQDFNVPIRIGVNSGSVDENIRQKVPLKSDQLVESALDYLNFFEKNDFNQLVFSLKASSVQDTIEANRKFADLASYPLHLGVTEAGIAESALIKSAVGIGTLLAEGIGDTIRVSITGDPVEEVVAGKRILESLDLSRDSGVNLISCPTCGRTKIDLVSIADQVSKKLKNVNKPLNVAVMGCAVNGPGEAREADIGIAGGDGYGILFKKGEIVKRVPEEQLVETLLEEIDQL